ncbi:hypothetical protein HMP0015_1144 [Acinetobacter haemolyticus ATCC 19194]|uniref:Uncharacterized protein n=1 Tax=Acinetobacter haemolyticus ATCC 19194 TaxID=707232 RepID=D4XN52_ACIHA|nr:hypothetical protein HMP0015_1144 [Acinetobacter haemolyticus ATCC 19194]
MSNNAAAKMSLSLSFALRCDQSSALLLLRVMAKTAVNFVMKFDKGSTIVCISCLVYVVLANNAGMAEIIIIPL